MSDTILTILKKTYVKLASVADKKDLQWISREQARELADEIFRSAAAEIQRRTKEELVTNN